MPESIPASLVIDTLKDTFREARAARAFLAFLTRPAFKSKLAAAGLDYRE